MTVTGFSLIKICLWKATPLLLIMAVIELSDIAFDVDSIPAVFGVTRDPLIIFSSNIFAISGLRSFYVLISESMSDLEYLQPVHLRFGPYYIVVVTGWPLAYCYQFFDPLHIYMLAIGIVLGFIWTKMIFDFFVAAWLTQHS